jgi:NAD-dependent deacetylase
MNKLEAIIERARTVVFFGGAGVSTESGIPDFRSEKGLYAAQEAYGHAPEYLVSHTAFAREPELFFNYYKNNLVYEGAEPNDAHKALAKLERDGKLSAVITQNVDGLHQAAGSQNVFELHGSVKRNTCTGCGAKYALSYILDSANCVDGDGKPGVVPKCELCGATVKPDVVLYEEPLDEDVINGAVHAISRADVLIVGGTSLVVYPAAGFVNYFGGHDLILINKSETGMDARADLVIHEPIGEVLSVFL